MKVRTLTLADLIAGLSKGQEPLPAGSVSRANEIVIRSAVIDSRLVAPDSLFIAMRGAHMDGHDFIPQAVVGRAVVVIAEKVPPLGEYESIAIGNLQICRFAHFHCLIVDDSLAALQKVGAYWRRQHDTRVIGITGSIGKTTSKEVIAAVVSQRYRTLKSEGNYNNEIGLPLTLLHLTNTHERVVLEMGMYDLGEIALLADIALPQVGVVTNVGPSHLERLGTIERIAQAKAELPQALPPADKGGVVILNADDGWVRGMAAQTPARVFTYGLTPSADLWASDIDSEGLEGIHFQFHHGRETIHARVPMVGRHSVHTALCAAAVGLVEGLSWEEIMVGLQDQTVQLRLVAVPGPAGSTILDDTYNSSPASCIAALNLLDELDGRKVVVLGDMYELGRYEEEGHKIVGRRVRETANQLVTVGPLGRIIAEEAALVGMPADAVHFVENNAQATALLRSLIQSGDIVLIKGSRGLAMEGIVADLTEAEKEREPQAKEDPS